MPSNLINLKYINMKRIFCVVFLFINHLLLAQVTVEGIVAIVGNNIILKSDFEQQILQYQAQGLEVDSLMRIQVLEDLLFQKLMLHKAEIDSIEVTENDVFNEIDIPFVSDDSVFLASSVDYKFLFHFIQFIEIQSDYSKLHVLKRLESDSKFSHKHSYCDGY